MKLPVENAEYKFRRLISFTLLMVSRKL
jgi:hypothetical protein